MPTVLPSPTRFPSVWWRWLPQASVLRLVLVLPLVLGCESESLKPPVLANDPELFWNLELNHHAVILSTVAPYNRLTLVATPRNYLGEPLAGFPAPQYVSKDLERVSVTSDGVLIGIGRTSQPVPVIATLKVGSVKHVDTVLVQVDTASAPPVLTTFSVHPLPPDSAKLAAVWVDVTGSSYTDTLPVRATDANGAPITGLVLRFRSSDSTIATIDQRSGVIVGRRPGAVTFYASTNAYGIAKTDTLPYRIGWPLFGRIQIGTPGMPVALGTFIQSDFKVGVGAVIAWSNQNFQTGISVPEIDVTFDGDVVANVAPVGPSIVFVGFFEQFLFCGDCTNGGNFVLGATDRPQAAMRSFPVAGTYEYRSTMHKTTGRIVVVDEQ